MNSWIRRGALLLSLAAAPGFAGAQTADPYSVAGIDLFALSSPARGSLSQYYTGGSGAGLELTMPLPVGVASITASQVPYHGKAANFNDFTATEALVGWSLMLPLTSRFSAGAGVRAGEFMMAFADTVIAPGLRDEKEMLFGFTAAAGFRIAGPFSLAARASYDHVYLHVPTHFISGQAGLEYTLTLPGWLREFMH